MVACVLCACSAGSAATDTPAASAAWAASDAVTEATVASVNGEPIAVAELAVAAGHVRTRVAAELAARYGVKADGAFWTTPLGDQRPLDVLKQRALAFAVERKIEQLLMRDQGMMPDVSYRGYLAALSHENARRRAALEHGEPIYGPQEYGEREYLEYLRSNGIIALKQRLPGLTGSDAELRQDYEATKTSMFSRGRRIRVEVMRHDYSPGGSGNGPAQHAARAAMSRLEARLRGGETPAAAIARTPGVALRELVVQDPPAPSSRFAPRDPVEMAALKLDLHGHSDVLDTGDSLSIVRCAAIEPLGYRSFEEARTQLQYQHIDRALHARVQALVERAEVQIERGVYDSVVVN